VCGCETDANKGRGGEGRSREETLVMGLRAFCSDTFINLNENY